MLLKNKLLKQWKAYSLVLAGVYTLEIRAYQLLAGRHYQLCSEKSAGRIKARICD